MFFQDSNPDLFRNLNTQQRQAVECNPQTSALILAGAGSGKTRVLTTRIAWLLQHAHAGVHNIMAVTFTNKAAKEMQTRLSAMLPHNLRAMWLGTFHGICHRLLRLHYRDANLPQTFQILDSSDQTAIIKRLLKQMDIDEKVLAPRVLQGFINAQKEAGLRSGSLDAPDPYTQRLIRCYAEYEQLCQREGVVDFAELLLRSYELLNANATLLAHYHSRFTHILVDEFQDTNNLQYAWLKLLAGGGAAVFAVGDDDQSIYRFRGANVGNMAQFLRDFGVSEPIKLEQNYRSVGNILTAANAVIQNNSDRLGKNLRTDAPDGDKIRVFSAFNDLVEAEFIVSEIKMLQREGHDLNQIALLYRSNAQSRVLEQALFQAAVPYKIYGGLRFYERQEVKHALAYLRLAINPDDDNALLRVINFPPRGIGTRTIENIQAAAQTSGTTLFQAACTMGKKTAPFIDLIEQLRGQVGVVSLPELVQSVLDLSGLITHYQNQKQIAEQERVENLHELLNAATYFRVEDVQLDTLPENLADHAALPIIAFLSNAALESGENQAGKGDSAVQMMTVHAAKGLEFDVVFLSGMEEGRFPSELSLNEAGGLAEERRLMYVAITRARQRLYVSMAQQRMLHGVSQFGVPSRFVDELPENVLQHLSPKPKSKNSQENSHLKFHQHAPAVSNQELPRDFDGFLIGENVRHGKFGVGVIIDAVDGGSSAKLTINFGVDGIKVLDTAFAKLAKL
ncbi:UvrD-helicase domain-containing protein [Alysiella filiformis]|uniref:DNA 3'-5' helicase n=1 Tax=Alysiella filiformis DSM 16848 TaxID=1120981 RepID=A0A286E947_9NEIS|nr:UvrD-helicase domain-containing protein [Alysiella filiformis]QMT31454.1 UvrD-helicase domain-containing protein [Alysiella filiformis]UBQ55534.1 UvrD-helicase domain-containing protein [Alysiella filiformis DSM 16848]SOD67421.1 ATP-dependent DNA helicase UvrD [Alysiella filiformis DSM 16848]